MTIERKVGMGIAGQPSGGATDVADMFSTHLWTGTGNAHTENNGIDLAGEGGLVWIKSRTQAAFDHALLDTDRGVTKILRSSSNAAEITDSNYLTSFNSTGFSVGASNQVSYDTGDFVSFTFRKKKKFFDVVTYTGNGTTVPYISQAVSHNLGSVPAMMIVKQTSGSAGWIVYHKDIGNTHELVLNETGGKADSLIAWNDTTPTDTVFTVGADSNTTNKSGQTFVAYLFADNSSEDADDQMIKCGSGTTDSSDEKCTITLGWEPQFVLVKRTDSSGNWEIYDSMRGFGADGEEANDKVLSANLSSSEANAGRGGIHANGFTVRYIGSNADFIYMAIRAPMMVEPEAATDVFHVDTNNNSDNPTVNAPFPIDTYIYKDTTGGAALTASRLTQGERLQISSTGASSVMAQYVFDYQNAAHAAVLGVNLYNYAWKRAKGYFDVVCYKGTGVGGRTQAHSLGVAPEMMWVRRRDGGGGHWMVYHTGMGNTSRVILNSASQLGTNITYWNDTSPTDSVFTVGSSSDVNASNLNFISYHFATLDGISKVGSYTGNGSNQTIDCGFSAGSRFILIRRTNVSTSNWYVWDSVRGIVAGNDPHFSLNTTATHVTTDDSVDPHNSGFIVNQVSATNINVSSHTYIFYAIA